MKTDLNSLIISIFINNIKIMALKKSGIIKRMKAELTIAFLMVDMKSIIFYFGLKVERNREKQIIKLFQLIYIDKILNKFYLNKANIINILMKETTLL